MVLQGAKGISLDPERSSANSLSLSHASVMENHMTVDAPRPRKPVPFLPYDVSLPRERIARMLPVHEGKGVSHGLVEYLTEEMNAEVHRSSRTIFTGP